MVHIVDREGSVDGRPPYDPWLYGYDSLVVKVGALIIGRRIDEHDLCIGEEIWLYEGNPQSPRPGSARPASYLDG